MLQNLPLVVLVNHVACKIFLTNSDLIVENISMCLIFSLPCSLLSDMERTGFLLRTAGWFLGCNMYPCFVSVSTTVFLHLKQYVIHMCCLLKPTIFKCGLHLACTTINTYLELMRIYGFETN